jgi:transposase
MHITMKEQQRIETLQAVMDDRIHVVEAAKVLKRCPRQIFRLLKVFRSKGLSGLIHGNKGRVSSRKTKDRIEKKILSLVEKKYKDINDHHLCEILLREENISIGRETLRRILRKEGIGPKQKKKRPKYHRRRQRKETFGMMIQIDASPHDWLEGRGPWLTLVGGRDDATNHTWARFHTSENLWSYLELVRAIADSHGIPLSLYSDKHTIFFSPRPQTIQEQLHNQIPTTQFGRAMEELGITLIKAHSPQAKGRIERCWGIMQDRLVTELRLVNVKTLEQANEVLQKFLLDWNQRFHVPPQQTTNLFRKSPASSTLDHILCIKEVRTVQNNHTVQFQGLILQIPPSKRFPYLAKRKVHVLQLQSGEICIQYKKHIIASFPFDTVKRLAKKLPAFSEIKRAA